jgi:hypothetical protein
MDGAKATVRQRRHGLMRRTQARNLAAVIITCERLTAPSLGGFACHTSTSRNMSQSDKRTYIYKQKEMSPISLSHFGTEHNIQQRHF